MMFDHPVWFLLTISSVVWYSTITIYITIKGYTDIQKMLRELGARNGTESETSR